MGNSSSKSCKETKASINTLVSTLEADKTRFLDSVEHAVSSYIEGEGKNCIALLTVTDCGSVICRWEPHADDDIGHYCKVLWKFVRKERYHGNKVESALTEPVFKIVEEKYEEFLEKHRDEWNKGFLEMLTADGLLMRAVMAALVEKAVKTASSEIQTTIVERVVHEIHNSVSSGTLHGVITNHVTVITSSTVGSAHSQVAIMIAHIIAKHLAIHIVTATSNFFASIAFHHALGILAHSIIIEAVSAAVFHFLAVHVGTAVGGSAISFIAIPLLAAFIIYKAHKFPKELGEAVGKGVRKKLKDEFMGINRSILNTVWKQLSDRDKLVEILVGDGEIQEMILKLALEYSDYKVLPLP